MNYCTNCGRKVRRISILTVPDLFLLWKNGLLGLFDTHNIYSCDTEGILHFREKFV